MLALLVVLAGTAVWPHPAAADSGATLRIDPPTQTVGRGQEFTVSVIQSSPVETTGAQADVTFDPKLLQLKSFELGSAYTSANAVFQFGSADLGNVGDVAKNIERANKFGNLIKVAGFLLPGSGTLPAGDQLFLKLTFVAAKDAGGQVTLGLFNGQMIDGQGQSLSPKSLNGAVVVGDTVASAGPGGSPGASGPAPSGSGLASAQPSPSPTAAPTATIEAPVSPTTPVTMAIAPTTLTLSAGDTARVYLIANGDGNISSAVADIHFDPAKIQIVGIEVSPPWAGAIAIAVATDKTKRGVDAAIAEANSTGLLQAAGAFFPPSVKDLPYGEGIFVSLLVQAKADGTSGLSISNAVAVGAVGDPLKVTVDPASLATPPEKGLALDPTLVVPAVLLLALVIGGVVAWRSGRIPVRVRRRWPFYVALTLGLIPVALFAGVVVMLLVNAAPVVGNPGIGALFGGEFLDAKGNPTGGFSILPPLYGTLLVTLIAAFVALPISLVLAIVAVDFPIGPVGRFIRPVVDLLSGVPPIVYAVSVPGFVLAFMIPKFAAGMTYDDFVQNGGVARIGADPSNWPPPSGVPFSPGGLPWVIGQNSTLLGGLLVGLFLIPFVTPLFVDALRNVPRATREASLALGANRTYTLRRVILPRALPAIAGASMFAVLKAMGDAMILLFAVGTAGLVPQPPFDVLERASGIGAWGASNIGSFEVLDQSCLPAQCAVGYSSAIALMLVAAVVVLAMSYLQARGRRRVAV